MLRCGNLNGNNITYDKDITNLIYGMYHQGIISGFGVISGAVQVGKAILYATRTNGEVVAVSIENTTPFSIDTSGTKKVYLTINQAKLDDGSENNIDGSEIVTIATGANYPASNCLALASISGGVITDDRIFIKSKNLLRDNIEFSIPYGYPNRYKLGKIKTVDSQRFKFDLICGVGYGGYGGSAGSEVKINASSTGSNITGSWVEIGGSSGIGEIKVVALGNYFYEIFIRVVNGSNPYGKIVMIVDGSSDFIFYKEFAQTNPVGGGVLDKIVPSIDVGSLGGHVNPEGSWYTNVWNGSVNFKTTLSDLAKAIIPTNFYNEGSPNNSFIVTLFNGSGNVKTTLANLVKGLGYATKTLQGVLRLSTDAEALAGAADTVGITPKQVKDNYENKYDILNVTRDVSTASGSVSYNHNLGVAPRCIKIFGAYSIPQNYGVGGYANGVTSGFSYGSSFEVRPSDITIMSGSHGIRLSISAVTSTNITVSYTKIGSWDGLAYINMILSN